MKILKGILLSSLYVITLLTTYYVHVTYFKVDVVFYSALLDSAIAASLMLFLLFFINFNSFEKTLLLIAWLLAGYSIAISVPTVIDRSLSFYILEKIQQRGGGIKLSGIEDVFTKEYIHEHRLMDVRLTEQLSSGTITIEDNCVKLTDRGKELASFSRFFRKHFLPKKRLLMGEYSDTLTDPFRNSKQTEHYLCK
ncbi:MAG: hypothetical protein ABW090_08835 [Sedimenticola sp.]